MWYCQEKNGIKIDKTNDILYSLKGELGDKEARISLAKFRLLGP